MAHEEAYSFKSLLVKQFPKVQKTENSEEKHWGKYQVLWFLLNPSKIAYKMIYY